MWPSAAMDNAFLRAPSVPLAKPDPSPVTFGGGWGHGASNPIVNYRGKLRENCGAAAKPPEASKSSTSAQGAHRAPTGTRGGQAKSNCGKIAEDRE